MWLIGEHKANDMHTDMQATVPFLSRNWLQLSLKMGTYQQVDYDVALVRPWFTVFTCVCVCVDVCLKVTLAVPQKGGTSYRPCKTCHICHFNTFCHILHSSLDYVNVRGCVRTCLDVWKQRHEKCRGTHTRTQTYAHTPAQTPHCTFILIYSSCLPLLLCLSPH